MPNKLSQFWQELKRRRVHRLLAIYAGSAYVVFEASTLIFPRWGLPDWTIDLVLYLLILGAIITFVVSWIYDVTPEGIQKTKPISEALEGEVPATPNGWKIASYISLVVIVALIVLNIIPRANNKKEILDKSIAVLPFRNDSPDQERMYFINGIMEAILDNLCKIEDLKVPGRTSVEQYRDNPKPIPVVAEEMNVSYVLEGSGHRDGNNVRLFVQLLDGRNDRHLWSKSYDADIEEIFSMQIEIAQLVAAEIEAIITPEEKELIEKVSTHSLTAHDFYLRGNEELWNYRSNPNNRDALDRAANLYYSALDYDSTYAQAYAGLAQVFRRKQTGEIFFSKEYLDSVLILANMALSYDDQLADAYIARGEFYRLRGEEDHAIIEFDKAIKLNPNNWEAYWSKAMLYMFDDLVNWIDNVNKAAILNRGPALPTLLRRLSSAYTVAGIFEKANYYNLEALKLDGDSVQYFLNLCDLEIILGNYDTGIEFEERAYALDSTQTYLLVELGKHYMVLGQYEESLKYLLKYVERIKELGDVNIQDMVEIGYVYWQNGYFDEAEYYFNAQIDYCNWTIELGRSWAKLKFIYYDLASVYAFKGEKEKAYENLRIFNQRHRMPSWAVSMIKNDPLFDSIRDEPEFQRIVRDVEAKYQAEHERVRQWLEENDML
jgi:TolB-like protein